MTNGLDWEVLEGGTNLDKAREKVMHASPLIPIELVESGLVQAGSK